MIGDPKNDTQPEVVHTHGDNKTYCPELMETGWEWLDQPSKLYFFDKTADVICNYWNIIHNDLKNTCYWDFNLKYINICFNCHSIRKQGLDNDKNDALR